MAGNEKKILEQAKRDVAWEVGCAIKQIEEMAVEKDLEVSWVLEEFKSQVISQINKKIQE